MHVTFGEYRLDLDARQLFRGSESVRVSPKAFMLLALLIERRPAALSKAELHHAIWPATFVSDASLAQLVSEIRSAIGDDAHEPRFVRTVHGFGYAFAADLCPTGTSAIDAEASPVRWWLLFDSREIPLQDGENVIGRDAAATVHLDSLRVSRYHARIMVGGDAALLEDLGSKNGTHLRGERLASPTALRPGDDVRIGPFSLTLRMSRSDQATETEMSENQNSTRAPS